MQKQMGGNSCVSFVGSKTIDIMDKTTRHISNRMEDEGIRLQIEAELKREISEEEWLEEVNEMMESIKIVRKDLSCSIDEAYDEIMH